MMFLLLLPSSVPTGLANLARDIQHLAEAVELTHPQWLILLMAPWLCLRLIALAQRLRRNWLARSAAEIPLATIQRLLRPGDGSRGWPERAFWLGWFLLVIALTEPRWGLSQETGVAVGQDLIIVLDLSRSMLATDTRDPVSRWQTAIQATENLIRHLRQAGGDRVGFIIFAAKPYRLVPLTTDYDHLLAVVRGIDGRYPPPAIRPGPESRQSGTRIGAAIRAAVADHDPQFSGSQAILLISDGDDPASDEEWRQAISAARASGIPLHVVGIGNPDRDTVLRIDGRPLEVPGPAGFPIPVQTRLHEELLETIAREAGGQYLAARTNIPDLVAWWEEWKKFQKDREWSDDPLPLRRDRSPWFFLAAAGCLALAWWWRQS